jgi:AcrR family transcriptional regulator
VRTKRPEQAERMLDAAARLFGSQRFHEVRMEDVAAEADVGKGTIYRYFEDKDELYMSLLARAGKQLSERIRRSVEAADAPVAKLEGLVAASLEFFQEQPHVFDLIQRGDAQRGVDSPWQKTRDEAKELVEAILSEGNRRGELRVADPTTVTLILLGGLRAVLRFGKRPYSREIPKQIVHTVLFGAARKD